MRTIINALLGGLVVACFCTTAAQQQQQQTDGRYSSILDGPFTFRKRIPGQRSSTARSVVSSEIDLCDKTIGCAGVTFTLDPLQVSVHNFLPSVAKTMKKGRILSYVDKHDVSATTSMPVLLSYRSKKNSVFHRGRIVADPHDQHRRTIPSVGLSEAKSMCEKDSHCVAFTFPIVPSPAHQNISTAENITFVSNVSSIDREHGAADEWRSYISNAPDRVAGKVCPEHILIQKREYDQPYATKKCCKRRDPLPALEDLRRADELPRISCKNTSKEEFRAWYESPRLPVVLVGCDADWPASRKWTRRDLALRFENLTTFVGKFHNRRVDLDNYETWGWIKEAMATGGDYYIFDSLIAHPEVAKLTDDFTIPRPIENMYDLMHDFPPGYGPSRWFTYGSLGSGTWPHLDPIAADAWNYVARGYKWWVLFPRGEEENYGNLYCAEDCSAPIWNADHWFATVGISARLNEYDGMDPYKRPIHVLQKPGEVLYIPNGVVHAVLNLDDTIAVGKSTRVRLYNLFYEKYFPTKPPSWLLLRFYFPRFSLPTCSCPFCLDTKLGRGVEHDC